MATGDLETNDLIARAHKACTRAANVADQLKTTIERAQGTSAKTRGEELAHSRLVELNELVENLNKRLESHPPSSRPRAS